MSGDYELLMAWRDGDKQAAGELLRRYFASVYQFFVNKVDVDVDDLVQRTFLAGLESAERFREGAAFRPYLLGIARKQLLMHLRSRGRWDKRFKLGEQSVEAMLDSPSKVVAGHEEERLLLTALRKLPLDIQMTVELHYWEDLTTAEIGEILEIPPGTVKSRLFRARELLREALESIDAPPLLQEATIENLDRWAAMLKELVHKDAP